VTEKNCFLGCDTVQSHRLLPNIKPYCYSNNFLFQGCQFKEHTLVLNSARDTEVHSLFMKHQNLITLEPPKLQFSERLTQLVRNRGNDE
jgi:hypothetical protein